MMVMIIKKLINKDIKFYFRVPRQNIERVGISKARCGALLMLYKILDNRLAQFVKQYSRRETEVVFDGTKYKVKFLTLNTKNLSYLGHTEDNPNEVYLAHFVYPDITKEVIK